MQPKEFNAALLKVDDCEMLALIRIPVEQRKQDAELLGSAWFDYRLLHPVKSTLLFSQNYERAVRDAYARIKDKEGAKTLKVLTERNVLLTRDAVSYWTARQACDRIGCRYDWALRWMFHRFADRGWHMIPRPNQLYAVDLLLDLQDAWKVECAASLQFPRSRFYRIDQWVGHPTQRAYRRFLVEQVKQRGTDPWRPLSRLFNERMLDPQSALEEFSEREVRKACASAGIALSHA